MLAHVMQQLLDLGAHGRADDAAEARAFERSCGACQAKAFGEPECEGSMKDVAGSERVDGWYREGLLASHRAAVVPERAVRAVSHREEATGKHVHVLEGRGKIADRGRRAQCFGGKDRV